ncbi:MAG TPA: 16S rRNA (guanine(527)-N(7))-methyltransferase RsmG [Stellaceae bacterium]|nr:16S rRNA (guanine(527)-N(7))-methyltransferase RsmG [Stellaceae bacterium]
MPPLTAASFQNQTGVSRETLARLEAYVELLSAWNRRINLVGPRTIGDIWRRHILDSAQLFPLIPAKARVLLDVGSGAGLPGLILAILGVREVHLVEADQRKCVFLREAARITQSSVQIHPQRLEKCPRFGADVITARAFAPLADLLDQVERFAGAHTILLFLKGKTVGEELTEARKAWNMRATPHPSVSDPSGTVLRLEQVTRADHDGGTARHP